MAGGKTIGEMMEEMRLKAGAKEYHGHSYMDLARFDENTKHMIIFDVLGGVIKSCQVHIGMSLVLLGTILNPLSLHQLSNRRISLHKNLLTEHLGQGYFCGEPNQL